MNTPNTIPNKNQVITAIINSIDARDIDLATYKNRLIGSNLYENLCSLFNIEPIKKSPVNWSTIKPNTKIYNKNNSKRIITFLSTPTLKTECHNCGYHPFNFNDHFPFYNCHIKGDCPAIDKQYFIGLLNNQIQSFEISDNWFLL